MQRAHLAWLAFLAALAAAGSPRPHAAAEDAPPPPQAPACPDPGGAGAAKSFALDFEGLAAGATLPAGLLPFEGRWAVVEEAGAPAPNRVLRQDLEARPWAVALATGEGRALGDLRARVRFKPVAGRDDRAGGIAFRARDAKNYYVARANGLEENLRLYIVRDGVRMQMGSTSVPAPTPGAWHTLEVEARGDRFKATLDGTHVVEAQDAALASGWVGLWTKADSTTEFDDLAVEPLAPPPPAK